MGLHQSALSLNITVAALAGAMLAGNQPFLATLPLAMSFVLLMVASAPVSFLIERIGWKSSFGVGALAGMIGCLLSALAMVEQSFILFCIALSILGVATAIGNYYRFAAAETQPPERRSTAVSTVLTGGVAAAILGPFLAIKGSDLFVYSFAGSYLIMTGLYLAIVPLLVLVGFPSVGHTRSATLGGAAGRKLVAIARQPIFLLAAIGAMLGYGTMNLIMVSTPTAMVGCGFVVADAGSVIQWHVLGMYVPSFFTGHLVRRFGAPSVMTLGAAIMVVCAIINLTGLAYVNFLSALVLLGLGWNFLYVGGSVLVTESYRREERTRTLGLNEFLVTASLAVTSLGSGAIYAGAGWQVLNLAIVPPLLLLGTAMAWFAVTRRRSVALT